MKIRHEINFQNRTTSDIPLELIYFDSSKYSGSLTFYLEALITSTIGSASFKLKNTSTSTVYGNTNFSAAGFFRSASFTGLPTGEYVIDNGNVAGVYQIKSARLIIIQDTGSSSLTASESQFEIGCYQNATTNTVAEALINPKYWKYVVAEWDGTVNFYVDVTYQVSNNMYGVTIALQVYNAGSWSNVLTIVSGGIATTPTRVRSSSFSPSNNALYRLVAHISNSMGTYTLFNAKIVVQQTGTDITKLQEQYLLANSLFVAGTSNQNYLTKWDSAEWDGVSNDYKHAVDGYASGTTSLFALRPEGSGTNISSSELGPVDSQTMSGSVTMPTNGNLDCVRYFGGEDAFASRIIVAVVKSVTSARRAITRARLIY